MTEYRVTMKTVDGKWIKANTLYSVVTFDDALRTCIRQWEGGGCAMAYRVETRSDDRPRWRAVMTMHTR